MSLHGSARFADDGQLCDAQEFACSTPEHWNDVGPLHIKVDLLQQQMRTVHEHIAKLSEETIAIKNHQAPIQVMQQRILQLETNELQLVRQMEQMKAELQRDFQAQLTASMFSALNCLQQPSKMAPIPEPHQKGIQQKEEPHASVTNITDVVRTKAVRSSKQVHRPKKLHGPGVDCSVVARVGEEEDVAAAVGSRALIQFSSRFRPPQMLSRGFLHSLYALLCLVTAVAAILALSRPGGREALRPASTTSYVYVTDVSSEGSRLTVSGSQEPRREPLPATAQYSAIPNGVSRCSHQELKHSLVASNTQSAGTETVLGSMPLSRDAALPKARTSASNNMPSAATETVLGSMPPSREPAPPKAHMSDFHSTLQQVLQPSGHPSGRPLDSAASKSSTTSLVGSTAGVKSFESPTLNYPASPSLAVMEFFQKYQGHIPVRCDTLNRKFAVEANMGGADFKEYLVSLPGVSAVSASPLELLVGDSGLRLLRPEQTMAEAYNEHRSHDGFLHVRIHGFLMPTSDVNLYLR
eukprot:TRINITY_DN72247_c0_g1_i1.p1 TRINITY_DN72247_c0_g1~~TRINITY_DN72247_c0_g1_i1.p1  ORF type:complete len:524 (+),score=87.29 TRINITY_DN72247_c0_g1_i1:41-1612(+)